MSEFDAIHLISLLGCLILAGSALTAYRLKWKQAIIYVLMWGAIFAGMTLFIDAVR